MKKIALTAAAVLLSFGCGGPAKDGPRFDKIEVERLSPRGGRDKAIVVTDRETLAQIAGFFPGVGQGKKSDIAGGWRPGYRLKFVPAEGAPILVSVDPDGKVWSEGHGNGDWQAKTGLKKYLDDLLARNADREADAGWSEAVSGLRGRLVRRARPRSNGREIIDLYVELKNVSTGPLAVRNDPASVRVRLLNLDGTPIPQQMPLARSGPVPGPQWGVLPRGCYLGFSLYDYGIGISAGPGAHLALLPTMQCWELKPGRYILHGRFAVSSPETETYQKIAWKGQLDLPTLEIEVR